MYDILTKESKICAFNANVGLYASLCLYTVLFSIKYSIYSIHWNAKTRIVSASIYYSHELYVCDDDDDDDAEQIHGGIFFFLGYMLLSSKQNNGHSLNKNKIIVIIFIMFAYFPFFCNRHTAHHRWQ